MESRDFMTQVALLCLTHRQICCVTESPAGEWTAEGRDIKGPIGWDAIVRL